MAMDLPRSLMYGVFSLFCCATLMAQEQEEYTVSSSQSSYRQTTGDSAVPSHEELDAYEAGENFWPEAEAAFGGARFDNATPETFVDPHLMQTAYEVPMAPPVDQQLRPRTNPPARNQSAHRQVAHQGQVAHQERYAEPRQLPHSHLQAQPTAQGMRPLKPQAAQARRQPVQQTAQQRSAYAQRSQAQQSTGGYYHAQHQHAHDQFVAPVQARAGLYPRTGVQTAGGGYLSQQNRRADQRHYHNHNIQAVQYESEPPRMPEPEERFSAPAETYHSEIVEGQEWVMASDYDPYMGSGMSYGCSECGQADCYGGCHSGGYCTGTGGDYCGCNDCLNRRFCGKHPQSRFKSDYAFADFIEPITNPYWFIDARSMTRARAVYIHQEIPQNNLTNSGTTDVTSLQGSLAINEYMSFLAQKTGRQTIDIDGQGELEGWLDMALGFKTVIIRNEMSRFLWSGGVIYERSNGTSEIYQGNGHGMWHIYMSTAKGFGKSHFLSSFGIHMPNNHDEENESYFYSMHLDHELFCDKFIVWELNGQHYSESGSRTLNSNIEGGDLFSLGSDNVTGNDVISTAIGFAIRLRDDIHLTGAYEAPLTNRQDFLDDRVTMTLSYFY
ncbi:MAG: hypothetical protein R3C11_15530 [Planctomycetaceae bacterium]